jgi:ABC-2 type transport system ATP-binding protein
LEDLRRATRQTFTVRFSDGIPLEGLRRARGVTDVHVHGDSVSGTIEGSPDALLAVLAAHPVEHLQLPEPTLEEAFRHFYEDGQP